NTRKTDVTEEEEEGDDETDVNTLCCQSVRWSSLVSCAATTPVTGGGQGTDGDKDTTAQAVYAPFDVKLNGKVIVYTDPKKAAINDGINLSGEGLCFKLFYVKPDKYSGVVKKGQRIGTMLTMQSVYPGITSHVHVQMCDKSDPTKFF
uniref:Leukocyte cell-derived chemotaxin 2 n=1 Tax=Oncorhynchus tshawytscha TaxID=74940 RepID=A0AAZ3PXM2_ONCTS